MRLKFIWTWALSIWATTFFGQAIELAPGRDVNSPGESMYYLITPAGEVDFNAISKRTDWKKCDKPVPNFLLKKDDVWVKMDIVNKGDNADYIFEVGHSALDEVQFYFVSEGDVQSMNITDKLPIDKRVIQNQNYCFPLNLKENQTGTMYMRVRNGDPIHIPVRIAEEQVMNYAHVNKDIWFCIFTGILMAMLLSNVFIYFRTREKSYVIYVVYIGIVYLTQSNFQGYTLRWFFSSAPYIERYATYVLSAAVGISALFFMSQFLGIKGYKKLKAVFVTVYLIAVSFALAGEFQWSFLIIELNAATLASWMLFISVKEWKSNNRQAINFVRAWIVFLVGVCIFVMKDFGVLPYNGFTFNVMTVGSAIETVLLSFALADKINILKKEKEEAQAREVLALQLKKDELQRQVDLQTEEVRHQRDQALQNLNELRVTQRQLLESEKLSALGQMTAGIAHELNNPINFVSSNIAPLNRDVDSVIQFMNEFEALPENSTQETIADLKKRYHDADMPYVKQEIEMLMKGIQEGARRTSDIVKGLRVFARADRDALVKGNLNDCMEATLVVMKSVIKEEVTLHKELDAALPDIECFPGKLNQVFVNLLSNAIHATKMEDRNKQDRHVWVKTWATEDSVFISVKDNGKGMDEMTRAKIFDPFFTTKGVGEGTGLGLSITLGILEEHKGQVSVNSSLGQGTEFLIEIPRNLKQIRHLAA